MPDTVSGEFGFIDRILRQFTLSSPDLIVPPGDDCAVIRISDDTSLLVTTDMLVEDVHFIRKATTFRQLGYKSMAVNLSDIAAMGGIPRHAFVSLAVPKNTGDSFFDEFAEGLADICKQFDVSLSGGDLTGSPDKIVINVCVTGVAGDRGYRMRSGAKPGDLVQISGPLGGSAAGLHLILGGKDLSVFPALQNAHCTPEPRIAAGIALTQLSEVHAMIDISDGLLQDLGHICRHSQTGAEIYADKVSLFKESLTAADGNAQKAVSWALTGGEDYELLWTVDPSAEKKALEAATNAGAPLPKTIGRIIRGNKVVTFQNNRMWTPSITGWDHFRR